MSIQHQAVKYGQRRLARRVARAIPWVGAAIALAGLGSAIRRKGLVRGSVHTALDAIPYVGGLKGAAEMVRGRDFLRDRA
jgi:hypothetical protein